MCLSRSVWNTYIVQSMKRSFMKDFHCEREKHTITAEIAANPNNRVKSSIIKQSHQNHPTVEYAQENFSNAMINQIISYVASLTNSTSILFFLKQVYLRKCGICWARKYFQSGFIPIDRLLQAPRLQERWKDLITDNWHTRLAIHWLSNFTFLTQNREASIQIIPKNYRAPTYTLRNLEGVSLKIIKIYK